MRMAIPLKMVSAVCFAACAVLGARAEEYHVYSELKDGLTGNQQLTNAFAKAQSGDIITIHKGTYNLATEEMMFRYETDAAGTPHATDGICLYSEVANLIIQGDPTAAREEVVLSGQGSKMTGDGQHAIMKLKGRNCIVRNLKFYKGNANSDFKVYKNGVHINKSDSWDTRRGGGIYQSTGSVLSNCVFESCYAGQGASVCGGLEMRNCAVIADNAVKNNAGCSVFNIQNVYDTLFEGNTRGVLRECSGVISNCVFKGNSHAPVDYAISGLLWRIKAAIVDCVFTNNTSCCICLDRAGYIPAEIRGCVFADNTDTSAYPGRAVIAGTLACTSPISDSRFSGAGQCLYDCSVISNCTFVSGASGGSVANCSQVIDCHFSGGVKTLQGGGSDSPVAVVDGCNLMRCTFSNFSIRWGFLFRNVRLMKNCLVVGGLYWGGNAGYIFRYSDGADALIENCTIVDVEASNAMYYNDGGSGTVTFRNTLFYHNAMANQTPGKYDFYDDTTLQGGALTAGLKMENTIFRAGNASRKSDIAVSGCENLWGKKFDPKFVKDVFPGEAHAHPYALHRKSPCIDAGDNGSYSPADLDLAGNLRVNGTVDIGCYENWDRIPGLTFILK